MTSTLDTAQDSRSLCGYTGRDAQSHMFPKNLVTDINYVLHRFLRGSLTDDLEINIASRQYLGIRVVKYDHLLHQKGDLLDLGASDR
jgi:hypothetical protein